VQEYGEFQDAWQPDCEVATRMGCVRIVDGIHDTTSDPDFIFNPGLFIHTNSAHTSVGLIEVKIEKSSGRIRLVTDGALMGTVIVGIDETAARQGLSFGPSGGNGYANIECGKLGVFQDLRIQSVYDAVASGNLNIWVEFHSPLVRGVGDPPKADRALALIADLEARVAALEA
jgi:hypothetical protein